MASVIGLSFGGLVVAWLVRHGVDLSWMMSGFDFAGLFIENVYKGSGDLRVFIEPTVVVFIGTIVMTLWPALKVARMKALDGIRQGGTTG